MSNSILTRAFAVACASGGEKSVLTHLADRAHDDGTCRSSVADISHRASVNRRSVFRFLRRLEKAGHLTIVQRPGTPSGFVIHPDVPVTPCHPCQGVTGATVAGEGCQGVTGGVTPWHGGVTGCHPEPLLTPIEPLLNPSGGGVGGDLFGQEPKPKPKRRPPEELPPDPIPAVLDTPAFREVWTEWMTCRRHMKKPGSWRSMFNHQLQKLAQTPGDAIEMVTQSIRNGWQGIFELKPASSTGAFHHQRNPEQYRNALMGGDTSPVLSAPGAVPKKAK